MASELDGGWEVYKILKLSYGGGGGAEGEGPIIQFTKNINKKPPQKNNKKPQNYTIARYQYIESTWGIKHLEQISR